MLSGPRRRFAAALFAILAAVAGGTAGAQENAVARGEYLFRAAGGCSCHTDPKGGGGVGGAFLAGGRALATPFGVFYSPNITPDTETGIGAWSDADFARAMGEGLAPDGSHYFPVFPYTAFTGRSAGDVADLKAYLDTVAAVRQTNRPHDVAPPFGWRFTVGAWKWLFFEPGPFRPDPERTERWNRGAYLATAVAHCAECHTPRNALGGLDRSRWLAGAEDGPEGKSVPNITPHRATGIGRWSAGDIGGLLKSGRKPDFDTIQGVMAEAIEHGYRYLSDGDRAAIADYVMSLPPIDNRIGRAPAQSQSEYE